jgi:hypothetical protein
LNADERQHQIVAATHQQGEVEVAKPTAELNDSVETLGKRERRWRTHGSLHFLETAEFATDLAICP